MINSGWKLCAGSGLSPLPGDLDFLKGKNDWTSGTRGWKQVRYSSWSKIRYLLHINGRRSPFVRWSSRIRWSSLRWSSRQLYLYPRCIFQSKHLKSILLTIIFIANHLIQSRVSILNFFPSTDTLPGIMVFLRWRNLSDCVRQMVKNIHSVLYAQKQL